MAAPTLAAIELLGTCEIMSAKADDGGRGIVLRLTGVGPDSEQSVFVIGVDLDMAADIAVNLEGTVQRSGMRARGPRPRPHIRKSDGAGGLASLQRRRPQKAGPNTTSEGPILPHREKIIHHGHQECR